MKTDIHPELHECTVTCSGCGTTFMTHSIRSEVRIEVCSSCHPFYTGKQARIVDTEGRVEKFVKKFEGQESRVSKRKRKMAAADADREARVERERAEVTKRAAEEKTLREEAKKKRAEERAARKAAQEAAADAPAVSDAPVADAASPAGAPPLAEAGSDTQAES
ncbi:MAG: 50S ribosomal protein L31 [bacterium]|nr:50S ribosomal protein L31 [bacterium]